MSIFYRFMKNSKIRGRQAAKSVLYYEKVYDLIKEVFPLKYWRGYIVAALFAALTVALMAFSNAHSVLVDMVYPYASRLIQTSLAGWVSGADFCLWQILAVLLGVLLLASIVLMLVFRWNFLQWFGWVLASASFLFMLHTGIYGLNFYAGPLSDDVRLDSLVDPETGAQLYLDTELVETTQYLLDIANDLATQVPRHADGTPNYPSFRELAEMAVDGFDTLVYDKTYSVFAGSAVPVKELGWADMYTSMGITGIHMPLTGESAVNPQTPAVAIPFVMCHEMSHRVCIAREQDANLGAFLACDANESPIFRYSGYFMAFRYCYNALAARNTSATAAAAEQIYANISDLVMQDLSSYRSFFTENQNEAFCNLADAANDTYLKVSGDEEGVKSYGQVTDLLVSWYVQEIYLPAHKDEEVTFNPLDKNQIDLNTSVTEGS